MPKMNPENAHIVLVHDEGVPPALLEDFYLNVNVDSLNFKRVKNSASGPYATLEWFIVPAIAIFLLKPYFDGFMEEAGRDHYIVLRDQLRKLWKKLFSKERSFRFAVMTGSGEKKLRYSALFSVYTISDNGHKIKLLINHGCSEDEFTSSIDAFLDFIEAYHRQIPLEGDPISQSVERPIGGHILVEYDKNSKSLKVIDPMLTTSGSEKSLK